MAVPENAKLELNFVAQINDLVHTMVKLKLVQLNFPLVKGDASPFRIMFPLFLD